ncbi:hypothetical protein BEST7613_4652 [Synechocystis sp. PCC 6803]|nr:hypothetical protein BEST7613_4652 [Synechocystis sp. PCC 6803] [Bacillus subtilis BEST7613]
MGKEKTGTKTEFSHRIEVGGSKECPQWGIIQEKQWLTPPGPHLSVAHPQSRNRMG